MFKSLDRKKIYEGSNLAYSFEFYSPIRKRDLASKFAKVLGKKVKWFSEVTEGLDASPDSFILSPIHSSNSKCFELKTGFMPYQDAIHTFLKVFNLIEHLGYTDDRNRVEVKINLNSKELDLPYSIDKLNQFKYLLELDEKSLLELWNVENEKQLVYSEQLKFIQPKTPYYTRITSSVVEKMDPTLFNFPKSEFFSHDFSNLGKGYVSVKYIGGKDYQKKKNESVNSINLIIERVYDTLIKNYEYSDSEKQKIKELVESYSDSIESTKSYYNLKSTYPNINVYVDLSNSNYLIESNYERFREKLFQIIVLGGVTEGVINFDTNRKKFQVKGAHIQRGILVEDFEFFECNIMADAKNCLFENCTIRNSKLEECYILSNNFIKSSKIIECSYTGKNNEISSSFIDNSESKMISAELRSCLVKNGVFSLDSRIDESTKILKSK